MRQSFTFRCGKTVIFDRFDGKYYIKNKWNVNIVADTYLGELTDLQAAVRFLHGEEISDNLGLKRAAHFSTATEQRLLFTHHTLHTACCAQLLHIQTCAHTQYM